MKNILKVFLVYLIINIIMVLFIKNSAFTISWVLFGLISFLLALLIIVIVFSGILSIVFAIIKEDFIAIKVLKKSALWGLALLVLAITQVLMSEYYSYIPQTSEIAYEEKVILNDTEQYITVRGSNENNPVILFFAGGPGGSQVQATREHLKDLEEDYTIVTWEQPGSGKSYNARKISSLTPDLYIEDAHALTNYLKETFNQDKIYLIGESWGSYVAVDLAMKYPSDYYSIITTGQMVDFAETEEYCYDMAFEIARDANDEQQIKALENLGRPPLTEGNISIDSATYLTYLYQYMAHSEDINHTSWSTFDTLISPEYSIKDSFNFMRALYFTFSQVYKQLYTTDLRESHTQLEVPIYILHGRHDINAPVYLVEDYYQQIEAPEKSLIFFEGSGHSPWITESELFNETVKSLFDN